MTQATGKTPAAAKKVAAKKTKAQSSELDAAVKAALPGMLRDVSEARVAPSAAARALLDLFVR